MRLPLHLAAILCLLLTTAAFGQRDRLSVGDPAPGLDVEEWLAGSETTIKQGQVYIIWFWETKGVEFRNVAPVLSRIQQDTVDFGLTVIGITTEEKDVVEPWLKRNGRDVSFAMALDRRSGTHRAWVQAADLDKDDMPVAFLVDRQSRIALIVTPSDHDRAAELNRVTRLVVRNRYDPALEASAAPMLDAARNARKTHTYRIALKQYDQVIDLSAMIFADVALERFEMVLVDMKQPRDAYAYARDKLLNGFFAEDADALAQLAEKIVLDPDIPADNRDLELALECATAARKIMDHPEMDAALAVVHFHRGETETAIRLQRRAFFRALPRFKPEYERVLKTYQEAERRSGLGTR